VAKAEAMVGKVIRVLEEEIRLAEVNHLVLRGRINSGSST